jgi:hypothetical protein
VRSIELTLDEATDAAFRADWHTLLLAELPSQARHAGDSNRPHVTIGAGARFPFDDEPDAVVPASDPDPGNTRGDEEVSGSTGALEPEDTAGSFRRSRLELVADRFRVLPLPLAFSGLVVFGAPPRGLVLARLVVPTAALLGLHAAVHAGAPGTTDLTAPGRWTPHVTLAHRLTPDQLARAVALVSSVPDGTGVGARLWDSGTREITELV